MEPGTVGTAACFRWLRTGTCGVIVGTQQRSAPDGEVTKRKVGKSTLVQSGWLPSPFVTKAAGMAFLLSGGFSEKSIRGPPLLPPRKVQGRGCGFRLKASRVDVTGGRCLLPSQTNWLRFVFSKTGGRSIPILAVDLNGGMGLEEVSGSYELSGTSAIVVQLYRRVRSGEKE
eukprot:6155847-Pyramimonas_sp.AAC.1